MFDKFKQRIKKRRGSVHNDFSKCSFCGSCQKACNSKAISVDAVLKSWAYISERCTRCLKCIRSCQDRSLSLLR